MSDRGIYHSKTVKAVGTNAKTVTKLLNIPAVLVAVFITILSFYLFDPLYSPIVKIRII